MDIEYLLKEIGGFVLIFTGRIVGHVLSQEFVLPHRAYSDSGNGNLAALVAVKTEIVGSHLAFGWPSALAFFAHGLNFAEVVGAAFGGCLAALATERNGGLVFLCHIERLLKPLAVCQMKARESAHYGHGLLLVGHSSGLA